MAGEKDAAATAADEAAERDRQKRIDRGDFVDDDVTDASLSAVAGEGEEGEEGAEGGDDDDAQGSRTVPHARFNEVNVQLQQEREARLRLEGENAALKRTPPAAAAAPAAVEVDLKALRKSLAGAILEADEDKIVALQEQIDEEIQTRATAAARKEVRAEVREEQDTERLNSAAEDVAEKYPFLDSGGAEANKQAIGLVVAQRNEFIRQGMRPDKALRKAAEEVAPLFVKGGGDDGDGKGDPVTERRTQAIARNAAANNRQPANLAAGGKGNRAGTREAAETNVEQLTDAQIRNMPKEEKARLRGDVL